VLNALVYFDLLHLLKMLLIMPLPSKNPRRRQDVLGYAVRPSGRPLTTILRDAISLYLVGGFRWNLAYIFIIWMAIAEKVFKVRG